MGDGKRVLWVVERIRPGQKSWCPMWSRTFPTRSGAREEQRVRAGIFGVREGHRYRVVKYTPEEK